MKNNDKLNFAKERITEERDLRFFVQQEEKTLYNNESNGYSAYKYRSALYCITLYHLNGNYVKIIHKIKDKTFSIK